MSDSVPASDIRYLVLSDLHLGDRDSVLTCLNADGSVDGANASPALEALVECLRDLVGANTGGGPVTLILNGDLLALAFGSGAVALNTFERFVERLFAPGRPLCDRVLFVPGNHDHHLWEMAREADYRREVARARYERGGLPAPRHVTGLRPAAAVPSVLLDTVLEHSRRGSGAAVAVQAETVDELDQEDLPRIGLLYPNLALVDATGGRAVVLHHGHYVEPLYHFFSKLRRILFPGRPAPTTVAEIEEENFAWIDFVWSLFGRSGGAGEDAQRIFDMLLYPERTQELARSLARRAAPVAKMPFLPSRWLRQFVLEHVFLRLAARASTERTKPHVICSEATIEGISSFLFGPTANQIAEEFGSVPADLTFIMGHTHKPFERVLSGSAIGRTAKVFNTGGWVIDALEPDPAFGASILAISESLEVASIRVFNDGQSDGHYLAGVRTAEGDEHDDPFAQHLRGVVTARHGVDGDPWAELAVAMRAEVAVRRRLHHHRRRVRD